MTNIHKYVNNKGLTLKEVAFKSGLSEKQMQRLASGKATPLLSTARTIAQVLGVSVDELFEVETTAIQTRIAKRKEFAMLSASLAFAILFWVAVFTFIEIKIEKQPTFRSWQVTQNEKYTTHAIKLVWGSNKTR